MASVTGYTAARMKEIEDKTIVDGAVVGNDLILTRNDDQTINAGNVRGPQGPAGPPGGLGEAPTDGYTYGRKEEQWVPVPFSGVEEAPVDGGQDGIYSRYNASWHVAPGTLLDEEFNAGDSSTALASAVSMAGDGTKVTVSVPPRGVTVDFGAQMGHSQAQKFVGVNLYIDGALQVKGQPLGWVPHAGAVVNLHRQANYKAGEITVAQHTFEIKAKQPTADASMTVYESWIAVRAN